MPDFTLCQNIECTLAPTCHRQQTESDFDQSVAEFEFELDERGDIICSSYWPVVERASSKLGTITFDATDTEWPLVGGQLKTIKAIIGII